MCFLKYLTSCSYCIYTLQLIGYYIIKINSKIKFLLVREEKILFNNLKRASETFIRFHSTNYRYFYIENYYVFCIARL